MVLEKSTDEKTQKNLDDHRFPRDTKGRFRKKTVDYLNRFPGNIANNEVRTENRASGGTLPKRCKYDTKLIQANNDQQLQKDYFMMILWKKEEAEGQFSNAMAVK